VYQDLGAATDVARLDADAAPAAQTVGGHGLTGREIEVLRWRWAARTAPSPRSSSS
jgi:hypothetical protein